MSGPDVVRFDARGHDSRRDLLGALGEALGLPTWFGRNLDALEECLRDLDRPVELLWTGPLDDGVAEVLRARATAEGRPAFAVRRVEG